MCTFRASCCSTRLSWAQVSAFAGSSVWDRKKRGEWMRGWLHALAGAREHQQSNVVGSKQRKGNVLFNDALNTFYLRLYGIRYMVKNHSDMHHPRQDNTYHCLCYTSHGALAGTRNSPMGPPWRIDPTTHRTMSERSYHRATSRPLQAEGVKVLWNLEWSVELSQKRICVHSMKEIGHNVDSLLKGNYKIN